MKILESAFSFMNQSRINSISGRADFPPHSVAVLLRKQTVEDPPIFLAENGGI